MSIRLTVRYLLFSYPLELVVLVLHSLKQMLLFSMIMIGILLWMPRLPIELIGQEEQRMYGSIDQSLRELQRREQYREHNRSRMYNQLFMLGECFREINLSLRKLWNYCLIRMKQMRMLQVSSCRRGKRKRKNR